MKLINKYGFSILQEGVKVYCKNHLINFTIGKQYEIYNIQLINGNETILIMVGDDDFPYQFYIIGESLLFVNYFTTDIKDIRKLKLEELSFLSE